MFLAALVLAAGLVVILITMFASIGRQARRQDALSIVSTILGMGVLSWFALRAVAASWRLRRVAWRSRNAASPQHCRAVAKRPSAQRGARTAGVGARNVRPGHFAALFVAIATGIGLLAGLAFYRSHWGAAGSCNARTTLALRWRKCAIGICVRHAVRTVVRGRPAGARAEGRYFSRLFRKRLTLEEFVVGRLVTLGPVVAIGKPGEAEPAGRRARVRARAGLARPRERPLGRIFVGVAILGGGEGLKWEYEQILQRDLTGRFILVVPPATPEVFRERWDIFQQAFPPAGRADLTRTAQFGGPLCAMFPDGQEPLLFCSKYQNETAYDVELPCSSPRCRLRLLHGAGSEWTMTVLATTTISRYSK